MGEFLQNLLSREPASIGHGDRSELIGLMLAAEKFWSLLRCQRQLSHFRRLGDQTLEA
ncbi:MAG: hypothetical protein NW220_12955 [Leptolyngbyaceae cyanobacterium bins.349]|nr:hypothetical protein [Leptolyngbyaceae cyanobacterium bins.349]